MEQIAAILPTLQRSKRPRKRLTLKERKFAQEYVKQNGNATQAALQAYDADTATAKVIGSRNLDKPRIIEEIDKILHKTQKLDTNEYIADKLIKSIENGMGIKATQKDSLTAINMLMKANNSYPGTKNTSVKLSLRGNLATESVSEVIEQLKGSQQKTNELIEDIS